MSIVVCLSGTGFDRSKIPISVLTPELSTTVQFDWSRVPLQIPKLFDAKLCGCKTRYVDRILNSPAPMFVRRGRYPKHDCEDFHMEDGEVTIFPASPWEVPSSCWQPGVTYRGSISGFSAEWVYFVFQVNGTWVTVLYASVHTGSFDTLYRRAWVVTPTSGGAWVTHHWATGDRRENAITKLKRTHPEWESGWTGRPIQVLLSESVQSGGSGLTFLPLSSPANDVSVTTVQRYVDQVEDLITVAVHRLYLDKVRPQLIDLFDEALSLYQGPNMSWLEFIIPFKEIPQSLLAMGVVPKTVKELAGYFLNFQYGVKTLPSDFTDLYDTFANLFMRIMRDNQHLVHLKARGGIYVPDLEVQVNVSCLGSVANKAAMAAAHLGVADPLTEIWNCIPYSFVIDWFTGIGDTLEHLEKAALWKSLELREICWSSKISGPLSVLLDGQLPNNVTVRGDFRAYWRKYETSLPERYWYQPPDVAWNMRRHWAELAALTVQQLR